jgi:hypothetical protein
VEDVTVGIESNLKRNVKKSQALVDLYYKTDEAFSYLLFGLSPVWLVKFHYFRAWGRWPDLETPRTFDEKLLWLMLNWRHPLKSRCADKYALRSYVEEHQLGHLLPKLVGVYETSAEVNFDTLPEQFALKCTHGCGFNIICSHKGLLDRKSARRLLEKWMRTDISRKGAEIHYALMKPRIMAEEFLADEAGGVPSDYKVFCFDGKAHCTMACTERGTGKAKFDFYDREWKTKLPYSKSSLSAARTIPMPAAYEVMLNAAEALSKPFPFVRMDFYSVGGRAVIGEMTFTPNACIDTGYTEEGQRILGSLIRMPERLL